MTPGVFEGSLSAAVNGPLWSLPAEIHLYLLLFLGFFLFRQHRTLLLIMLLCLASVPYLTGIDFDYRAFDLRQHSRLACYFFAGGLIACHWGWIGPRALKLGLLGLFACFALKLLPYNTALNGLALSSAVVCLGSLRGLSWFAKGGDSSYGIYIYAWPIQQFCILLIPDFWMSMAVAFIVTASVGYATWHAFEKRCMNRVDDMAELIHRNLQRLFRRRLA